MDSFINPFSVYSNYLKSILNVENRNKKVLHKFISTIHALKTIVCKLSVAKGYRFPHLCSVKFINKLSMGF